MKKTQKVSPKNKLNTYLSVIWSLYYFLCSLNSFMLSCKIVRLSCNIHDSRTSLQNNIKLFKLHKK